MNAPFTLGLDLGPTSVGWALVDEDNPRLVAAGVRVFPEGVDRDQQGGEQSKNEQRRVARGMRRQITRRSRRKERLRKPACCRRTWPHKRSWTAATLMSCGGGRWTRSSRLRDRPRAGPPGSAAGVLVQPQGRPRAKKREFGDVGGD